MSKKTDQTIVSVFNHPMTIIQAETKGYIKVNRTEDGAVIDYTVNAKQPPDMLTNGEFNGTTRTHS